MQAPPSLGPPSPPGPAPTVWQARRHEVLALGTLALLAAVLVALTPRLIVPWRAEAPWYESAATFPRLALLLLLVGALGDALRRLRGHHPVASDELDSGGAQLLRVGAALGLFCTYAVAVPVLGFGVSSAAFLAATARVVGLPWRMALALALPLAATLWLVFVPGLRVAFGHGLLF